MEKIKHAKLTGVRKFVTGESRYCQNCGKESYELFEIIQDGKIKNKLQYCKKCFDDR
jgi:ribosomal protein S27AE